MAAVGLAAQQMNVTLPTDMAVGLTYTQYISLVALWEEEFEIQLRRAMQLSDVLRWLYRRTDLDLNPLISA